MAEFCLKCFNEMNDTNYQEKGLLSFWFWRWELSLQLKYFTTKKA